MSPHVEIQVTVVVVISERGTVNQWCYTLVGIALWR